MSSRSNNLKEGNLNFRRRMMQIVLYLRRDNIAPIHVHRFQELGLLLDAKEKEKIPRHIVDIVANENHTQRIDVGVGPLVFVLDPAKKQIDVTEVQELLLNSEISIRNVALNFFRRDHKGKPWFSKGLRKEIDDNAASIRSSNKNRWRQAAIHLVQLIEQDYECSMSALRQSCNANYKQGLGVFLYKVLRPSVESLSRLQPVIRSPIAERQEIANVISNASSHSSFEDAFFEYLDMCGHLPLCKDHGAPELYSVWRSKNQPRSKVTLNDLRAIADRYGIPIAHFHAMNIALNEKTIHTARSGKLLWEQLMYLFEIGERDFSKWRLFCHLGNHFGQYIETVFPGTNGQSTAALSWWLASKASSVFSQSDKLAKYAIENGVLPELAPTSVRWSISKTPTIQSQIRYPTLLLKSMWTMSLLASLAANAGSLPWNSFPEEGKSETAKLINSILVSTDLCLPPTNEGFSLSLCGDVDDLMEAICQNEKQFADLLKKLVDVRREKFNSQAVSTDLSKLRELTDDAKTLALITLRDGVFRSKEFDKCVAKWLQDTEVFSQDLEHIPAFLFEVIKLTLEEFQQHYHDDWSTRVPHVLAFSLQQTDNRELAQKLISAILTTSANAGISSPIQRAYESKWRTEFVEIVGPWREYVLELSRSSQPWVRSRIRLVSATISRLIGPSVPLPDDSEHDVKALSNSNSARLKRPRAKKKHKDKKPRKT